MWRLNFSARFLTLTTGVLVIRYSVSLNKLWGPFTCDVFANSDNHKVDKFYSQFWTLGTAGVDAFAFDWFTYLNWFVPPVHLANKTINYIIHCRAKGTVIVPNWKSATFWPSLVNLEGNCLPFIVSYIEYKNPTNIFTFGSDKNSIFALQTFQSNVLVFRIDAS